MADKRSRALSALPQLLQQAEMAKGNHGSLYGFAHVVVDTLICCGQGDIYDLGITARAT